MHDLIHAELRTALLIRQNLEDALLGSIQHVGRVVGAVVAVAQDLGADIGQAPLNPLVADNLGVVLRVRRVWNRLQDFDQVRGTADVLQLQAGVQFLGQRDDVGSAIRFVQPQNGREDGLVNVAVEMLRPEDISDLVDGMILKQHATENTSLCHEVLRRKMGATKAAAGIQISHDQQPRNANEFARQNRDIAVWKKNGDAPQAGCVAVVNNQGSKLKVTSSQRGQPTL